MKAWRRPGAAVSVIQRCSSCRRFASAAALVAATLIAFPASEVAPDAPRAVAQETVEAPPAPILQSPVKDTFDIEVATPDAWGPAR